MVNQLQDFIIKVMELQDDPSQQAKQRGACPEAWNRDMWTDALRNLHPTAPRALQACRSTPSLASGDALPLPAAHTKDSPGVMFIFPKIPSTSPHGF